MIRRSLLIAVAVVALISPALASAQSNGRITGVVRDATGSVSPGATVVITNQATKEARTVTTDATGNYSQSVPPGSYTVAVSMQGFQRMTQQVDVQPGSSKQLEFSLETQLSEEITVTATKREQTLLEVPFSVAALTEERLRMRGVQTIEDVAANVGGLTVQNLGPGQSQVAIRGVSAGQIVRDQPGVKEQVGVYLDESVVSLSLFTPDLDLFDTNRVEVLRGPQGTLFGSGSLTGTGPLHHQPARARGHKRVRRAQLQRRWREPRRRRQGGRQFSARRQGGPAGPRLLRPGRRVHRCRSAGSQRSGRT